MNSTSLPHYKSTRRKRMVTWFVSIVVGTLLLSVGVSIFMTLETSASHKQRLLPSGQFQADARTLLAAVNYLLDRDTDFGLPTATAPSNFAIQPMTSAAFCCVSNQAELLSEPITNEPARS